MNREQRWNLHMCVLDAKCRRYAGWCWRIELNTPWWRAGVALSPGSRFARLDGCSWLVFQRH